MNSKSHTRISRLLLFCLFTSVIALAFCVYGCSDSQMSQSSQSAASQSSQVSSKHAEVAPLKVAVQYNPLSIPTVFANENNYFSELGLDVEISTFANGAEENKAIEKGDVDIASDGLASVYMLATGQFSWIGESDAATSTVGVYIKGGSAPAEISSQLIDSPDVLGSADTLRGLTVVGPAGTMEEWTAVKYFSQFGLNPGADFEFIEMDRAQAVDSVLNGESDIFVATDVDYCRIMEDNGFVALAKGTQATQIPFNNGYLVRNKLLETRYDDLVSFLIAVYRAAETLNNDPVLWNNFAYEFYKSNGKPATMEDVERESKIRSFLVPSDFEASTYRLGRGVLDVGEFNAEIGALDISQVEAIQDCINTKVLEDAFGITVQAARVGDNAEQ